jgi:hypothetical protein
MPLRGDKQSHRKLVQSLGLPDRTVGLELCFGSVSELETVVVSDTIQSIDQDAKIYREHGAVLYRTKGENIEWRGSQTLEFSSGR